MTESNNKENGVPKPLTAEQGQLLIFLLARLTVQLQKITDGKSIGPKIPSRFTSSIG